MASLKLLKAQNDWKLWKDEDNNTYRVSHVEYNNETEENEKTTWELDTYEEANATYKGDK